MSGKAFKLVLLGESAVGKSSIVLRYMKDEFLTSVDPTIGVAYSTKSTRLRDGTYIPFEIWDTAGQERYHSLAPMYYRAAQAAIVVYDIRRQVTYEKAKRWITELKSSTASDDIVIALVGNKVDMASEREVKRNAAEAYAQEGGLLFMETSAKTNENVAELFDAIAERLRKVFGSVPDGRPSGTVTHLPEFDDDSGKGGCC